MSVVTYRPADVIRWLGQSAKKDRQAAVNRALAVPNLTAEKGIVKGLQDAAESAFGLGKQAMDDLSTKKAEEKSFLLYDTGFELTGLLKRMKVDYKDIKEIITKDNDKFWVVYTGGHVSIKPVAHLVSGTVKVPIGWLRNGLEVDYVVLVQEIAARSGVEVLPR